jgi:hypothetical protein
MLHERRERVRVAPGQHGQDRQRIDELLERRERPQRGGGPELRRHAPLRGEEPAADATAGDQPQPYEIAPGQAGFDHLLTLGERAQGASIAAVAQQGTHRYVPPSGPPGAPVEGIRNLNDFRPEARAFQPD